MGALFLSSKESVLRSAEATLMRQGFGRATRLQAGRLTVLSFGYAGSAAPSSVKRPDGGFAAAAGTFLYGGSTGPEALSLFYDDFTGDLALLQQALGSFALAVWKDGALFVTSDAASLYPIYVAKDAASSSFTALAESQTLTADKDAIIEYVANGAVYGEDTIFREIRALPRATYLQADLAVKARYLADYPHSGGGPDEQLARSHASLERYFQSVAQMFGDRISMPLTAGYDSRLIFAHLRRLGIKPKAFIFKQGDEDTETASAVANAGGVALEVIDRSASRVSIDAFPQLLSERFDRLDGMFFAGLFSDEAEAAFDRGGTVMLHGAGGEIYRDFFQVPRGRVSSAGLARAFFMKFDPSPYRDFDQARYLQRMTAKIEALVGRNFGEREVSWLYPNLRGRGWFGREAIVNNARDMTLTPYFEASISGPAVDIPRSSKAAGAFEAALIARASPELAAVTSQYGHDFLKIPWKRKIGDQIKSALPTELRPLLYARRARKAATPPTGYLQASYLREAFPKGAERLAAWFRLDEPMPAEQRSRIFSVEYALQRLSAG